TTGDADLQVKAVDSRGELSEDAATLELHVTGTVPEPDLLPGFIVSSDTHWDMHYALAPIMLTFSHPLAATISAEDLAGHLFLTGPDCDWVDFDVVQVSSRQYLVEPTDADADGHYVLAITDDDLDNPLEDNSEFPARLSGLLPTWEFRVTHAPTTET